MNPVVVYTLLRLGLLAVVLLAVRLVADGLLWLGLSAVISMALSYLLLAGPRSAVNRQIEQRLAARSTRQARTTSEDEAVEDAAVDAAADPRRAGPDREAGRA